jgi:ppGpp synthetase/RelA/SpoT-type nucleotidyltranferase
MSEKLNFDPKEVIEKYKDTKHYKAELQLRTLAQHMWADVYHEMGYKNEFQLPQRWERDFAGAAAILET